MGDEMKYDVALMEFVAFPIIGIFMMLLGYTYFMESTFLPYKCVLGIGVFGTGCFLIAGDIYLIYHRIVDKLKEGK